MRANEYKLALNKFNLQIIRKYLHAQGAPTVFWLRSKKSNHVEGSS